MTANEKKSINERYQYLKRMQQRYLKADKKRKATLLDEMEAITGRNRDYLSHILKGPLKRRPRQRQRTRLYKADFDRALRIIYEVYDRICAERLQPNLLQLAEHWRDTTN